MDVEQYARSFDDRVAGVLAPAARLVPALARRLAAADVKAEDLVDVATLDRLPVLSKDELLELQAQEPPFGGLLAPGAVIRRIFQSPGPLYEPEVDEPDPWRMRSALEAAGIGPGDVVLNCFGYHLSPAGVMFEEAAQVLGCRVVPAGVGNVELQARAAHDLSATGYMGLPSYLKALLERAEELELPLRLERAFCAAEPLPPSLRNWLSERVAVVRQGYGTAECGNLGYECDRVNGWHVPDDALVEVCNLDDGQPRRDGGEGQVVATVFSPDYPLVRIGTGDISAFAPGECDCGRPTPRLVGWLGRVGEAVKVRGMFLHPRQVHQAMAGVTGVSGYRFVVDRIDHKDVLRCEIVVESGATEDDIVQAVRAQARSALRFDVEVAVVPSLEDVDRVIADLRSWG